eukprot:3086562-Rhodomonas_salina.1
MHGAREERGRKKREEEQTQAATLFDLHPQLQVAGVRACIMAGHALNNTAHSRLEALRTGGVDAGPGIPPSQSHWHRLRGL